MRNQRKHLPKVEERKDCGAITCIHCVANTCTLEECDMYERKLKQETRLKKPPKSRAIKKNP